MDPNASRFEDTLSGLFSRVRLSQDQVRINAYDLLPLLVGVLFISFAIGMIASALTESPLLLASALLLGACAPATTRLHVEVRLGQVRVVRSVLWVPWSIRTYGASVHDVSLDADGMHLRVGDEEWPTCVLSAELNLIRAEELKTIHAACARLLA